MRRVVLMVLGSVAALGVAPGTANATTWCVDDPACPAGADTSQTTIQGAVTAAAMSGDTILIGPGKFMEAVNTAGKTIDFIGAGAAQTVIQSPTLGSTTLSAGNGGTITDLGVELAGGTGSTALLISGAAVRVAVTAPPGTTSGIGAALFGATFDDGTIALPLGPGTSTVGVESFAGPSGAVQDSSVVASDGLNSVTTAVRDRILATRGILENNAGGVSADFVIDDVAIETVPGPLAELGISASAATPASGTAALGLTIRHSTILGSGALGSTGLSVDAIAGTGDVSAPVTLDSSIVQGYATAIDRVATGAGGHSAAASVHTDYSDLSGVETSTNNGVPTGTGSIVDGSHDLSAAPGFVNNVLSDPRGLHLLDTSALIDAGNPVLGQGESPSDGDGAPRDLAGRNGAKAVTDIGAFEFQPHPPVLTVSGPSAPVPAGTVATFAASATDPDPGDALSFSWQFDDGAVASGVAVSHAFASTGTHTATVTVSDLDGFTATASASVVIAAPPARPSITVLKLTPRVLIAAISGPTITPSRHVGALVSYRDSVSASTTLTVVRVVAGVRRGGRCFVLTGKPRHRARCSITRTIGSFTRADRVGANRFRFSGRLGGRSLAAGTYRLVAQPQSSAGTGKAVSAPFRVRLG